MSYSRRRAAGARAALAWGALVFALVQGALDVAVVARHPELQDPETGARLAVLRERLAEAPGRPLLVAVGSSRSQFAFVPEKLPPLNTPAGDRVLAFNFSHMGAGPGMNLLEVRRLLRNGIRPRWLVLEVLPTALGKENELLMMVSANQQDLPVTRQYVSPLKVYGHFLRCQLAPCYKYRRFLARSAVPDWVPDADWEADQVRLDRLGGQHTWIGPFETGSAPARQWLTWAHDSNAPVLEDLHIAGRSDRALRDLIGLCRREGIEVVLLLTPEATTFRGWYSDESRRRVDAYCAGVSRAWDVPLIDARDWLDDRGFFDTHHVTAAGAEAFTRRLGREVLRPLVEGRLPGPSRAAAHDPSRARGTVE